MDKRSIFSFTNYKKYLKFLFSNQDATFKRLSMAFLARKTGYQRSFFSRVVKGDLQLTTEAVYRIARTLNFSQQEHDYFLWLVEKERASDADYRAYANEKAAQIKIDYESQQKSGKLNAAQEQPYFSSYLSSWVWIAVHLATSIPELRTPSAIADRLGISVDMVKIILEELVKLNLVIHHDRKFHFSKGSIHISGDSPWVLLHHNNWRQKALLDLQYKKLDSIHYTNILTVSGFDFEKIRSVLNQCLHDVIKTAQPSVPKELVCLNLDFFKI